MPARAKSFGLRLFYTALKQVMLAGGVRPAFGLRLFYTTLKQISVNALKRKHFGLPFLRYSKNGLVLLERHSVPLAYSESTLL